MILILRRKKMGENYGVYKINRTTLRRKELDRPRHRWKDTDIKGEGKFHPRTGHEGSEGGIEV
jgi:hypothetical protein